MSRKDRVEQFNIQVGPKIHLGFVQNLLAEETLAQDEVGVGKVGKSLQQNLHDDMHLVRHLQYLLEGEDALNQLIRVRRWGIMTCEAKLDVPHGISSHPSYPSGLG